MERFYILIAGSLVTVVLVMTLRKQNGELALLLGLCGCALVLAGLAWFLEPVMGFLGRIQTLTALDPDLLGILVKIAAISFTAEIAGLVCQDAGNSALGKSLQLLASSVILWLALPMLERLLAMAERILVNL